MWWFAQVICSLTVLRLNLVDGSLENVWLLFWADLLLCLRQSRQYIPFFLNINKPPDTSLGTKACLPPKPTTRAENNLSFWSSCHDPSLLLRFCCSPCFSIYESDAFYRFVLMKINFQRLPLSPLLLVVEHSVTITMLCYPHWEELGHLKLNCLIDE